jgi:hypothetical protein
MTYRNRKRPVEFYDMRPLWVTVLKLYENLAGLHPQAVAKALEEIRAHDLADGIPERDRFSWNRALDRALDDAEFYLNLPFDSVELLVNVAWKLDRQGVASLVYYCGYRRCYASIVRNGGGRFPFDRLESITRPWGLWQLADSCLLMLKIPPLTEFDPTSRRDVYCLPVPSWPVYQLFPAQTVEQHSEPFDGQYGHGGGRRLQQQTRVRQRVNRRESDYCPGESWPEW